MAVKASTYELLVLLVFYIAAMMFFGFFVYYAESYLQPKRIPSGSPITSIPLGIWYSLETVTTVGYGDMYPVTWGGYIVGVVCQLVGVILLSLTIPVVSSNFSRFYAYAKTRDPRKRYNRQRLRKLRDEETRRMSQHHDDEKEVEQRTVDIEHEVMQT